MSEQVLAEGPRFSFYQVVRLLQAMHPDAPPVGRQGPPEREVLRFRPVLDMSFARSDVAAVEQIDLQDGQVRYDVSTTFLALYGTVSPLPTFYTEQLLDESRSQLTRGLIDLFHHRLISLFFRVWEKYSNVPAPQDRAGDVTLPRLLALAGFDERSAPLPPSALDQWQALSIAGVAAQQPRSAATLAAILRQAFPDTHVDVQPCVGRWVEVPPSGRSRLARANCRIGLDLTLGERVYTWNNTFRIVMGPVGAGPFFQLLLPGAALMTKLKQIVGLFNPDGLDWELEVRIRPEAIPELHLGDQSARLGWSAWIGRRPSSIVSVHLRSQGA